MAITIQTTTYKVIYIYSRDAHPGLLKIGKTSVDAYDVAKLTDNCEKLQEATKERIKEAATFGITDLHILHTEVGYFVDSEGIEKSFDDHAVHEVLLNSGYIKADMTTVAGVPDEWFEVPLEKAIEAVKAVKEEKEKIDGPIIKSEKTPIIKFREEQELAITSTLQHYAESEESNDRKMLWNAKMRFGKTLCALELINRLDVKKVMILTHRPTVRSGWFDDYHLIKFHNEWQYGSKNGKKHAILNDKKNHYEGYVTGKDLETLLGDLDKKDTRFIYFASMQDLRGQKVTKDADDNVISREWKENNKQVYETKWDLIIFDEAHEGTQTVLGKEVIAGLTYNNDPLKLYLSGTPFNILSQFEPEEIFTWDYVMEQKAKEEWNVNHPNEANPYEGLAKLNIYTYNLGDVYGNNPEYVKKTEDDYFNFTEFFRVFKGNKEEDGIEMPEGASAGHFIHEKDVVAFLDLLCQKEPASQYPYSTDDFCNALSHTLWMLPGVAQAARLETLILNHKLHTEYGFEVVNVAGEGNAIESADPDDTTKIEKKEKDALEKVKNALKNNKRTITLSCGKLTTGVSIPEWTGVFMLSGGYSTGAANYMQTIFRGQTPYKNGAIKKNCYAFDFAPDRTLTVIDDYVKMQPSSRNGQKRAHGDRIKTVGDYLRFCPVIGLKGSEEVEYDALTFIKKVNQTYDDHIIKNGFKSRYLFKNMALFTQEDHELLAKVENLMGGAKNVKINSDGTINMADNDLKGDKSKNGKGKKKDSGKSKTSTGKNDTKPTKPKNKTKSQEQEQRRKSQRVLDAIFVRFPLLLFGAVEDADKITLDELLSEEVIDNESWNEFMPQGFTKPIFNQIAHLIDIDNLISSTSVIINQAKDADKLPIKERIVEVARMISKFHFTDNETVLTPWRVVNLHMANTLGGYDFYDETHSNLLETPVLREQAEITTSIFCNPEAHVLEINSKSGVYPLWIAHTFWALLRNDSQSFDEDWKLWKSVVENNIYVVCKTPMAEKITRRVLCGYNKEIQANTVSFKNLIAILKDDKKRADLRKKISKQSTYGKSTNDMIKFQAVVGNPPYQITVAKKETKNGQKRVSNIFHHFQILSDELGKYTSLIYPGGRWIHRSGKGLADFGINQINDVHLRRIIYYPIAGDIFKDAGIPDGLSIVLKDMTKDAMGFEYLYGNTTTINQVDNPGEDLMILNPMDEMIVDLIAQKVNEEDSFRYLYDSVLSRQLFGIESDFVEKNPNLVRPYNEGDTFDPSTEIKLFTNDKAGKTGRAKWYITQRSVITTSAEYIDQWKVIVSSANAGGQKRSNQLEIVDNHSAFGRSRVALKAFDGEDAQQQAENFYKYVKSELIRFAFLMTDESLTSLAKRVPDIVDYSNDNGYIDFSGNVNEQVYRLFGINDDDQKAYIRSVLATKADGLNSVDAEDNDEE